jgi:hypothetical protein
LVEINALPSRADTLVRPSPDPCLFDGSSFPYLSAMCRSVGRHAGIVSYRQAMSVENVQDYLDKLKAAM